MSDIKFNKLNEYNYYYSAKKKMPSGMTAEIEFLGYINHEPDNSPKYSSIIDFHISMDVYKKRKQKSDNYLVTTGKDGVSTLMFAREAISAFEEFIKEEASSFRAAYLMIEWTDNRRRDVYKRGLRSLGFDFKNMYGSKVLCKQLVY